MLADGQTHVVLSKFDPDSWLSTVERYRVTIAVLVPTQMRQILEHENLNNYDLASLRLLVYGAAPSPGPLVEKAYKELNCGLYQGYGISECVTSLTALLPQDHVLAMTKRPELLGSCGRPVPGVYIEIRNKNGGLVKCGEVGEIWVLTEKVMAGYWNDEIQTAKVLKDGWFRTGDLAHQDEEGYLFIVGRKTDMLISGGVNIYPSEIEEVLCHHPKIKEVAVVGVSDSNWGERPVAYVKTDGDCEMLELRKFSEK